ncbi:MAG: ornithine carbamoyltransferase [Ignisphaera sp.]|uniref:Ornithine carbamoyltransferase n=1 Tax=Ignisphaera aggregans TaxID=334771 RepID=A0A7C4NN89_9CREN
MFVDSLRGKDFISILDCTKEEIEHLVNLAFELKNRYYQGEKVIPVLSGKILALIFEKPSTRTRVSLQVAMNQLGGNSLYLSSQELQLARGEPIKDTARVLDRYVDGIAARVYRHSTLIELANYSKNPVINALSDFEHPLQALADIMTIVEVKRNLKQLKIAFVGDGGDNVLHSLMLAIAMLGGKLYIATPQGYDPNAFILKIVKELVVHSDGEIVIVRDPVEAVKDSDVVYTDVWISMGQEVEKEKRLRDFKQYQVNAELVKYAKKDYIFMHCLPAHRDEEVTDDVIESPNSVVWLQAENRLHTAKAVLASILR